MSKKITAIIKSQAEVLSERLEDGKVTLTQPIHFYETPPDSNYSDSYNKTMAQYEQEHRGKRLEFEKYIHKSGWFYHAGWNYHKTWLKDIEEVDSHIEKLKEAAARAAKGEDVKILVGNSEHNISTKRYLHSINASGMPVIYASGETAWTSNGGLASYQYWKFPE